MDVNVIMKKVEEGDIQAVRQFIQNRPDKVSYSLYRLLNVDYLFIKFYKTYICP